MVRAKASSFSILRSPLPDLPSPLRALRFPLQTGNQQPEMALPKCLKCGLVMDRPGEKRPSISCKQCKKDYCCQCADVTVDLCSMMKDMGKSIWTCGKCEANDADMKAVLDSMRSIKTDLGAITKRQTAQEKGQEKVLEGLKVVESVVKRMEQVEERQDRQEQKLAKHDDEIDKNSRKMQEGENRLKKLEERMELTEKNDGNEARHFNTVVQEVREIEKRERNVVIFNVKEPMGEEEEKEEDRKEKIKEIFKELSCEAIQPQKIVRIGKAGRFPRQILAVLSSADECERLIKKSRDGPKLKDEVFVTRDRTFRQRQEAKQFRLEKEKEEREGDASQPGRGRGGRGRGRSRGGGGRGRGGRGANSISTSRKRRNSCDAGNAEPNEEEVKRQKTGGGTGGGGGATAVSDNQSPARVKPTTSVPDCEMGAVGGEENF